jgi:signal transduction histidine kinase
MSMTEPLRMRGGDGGAAPLPATAGMAATTPYDLGRSALERGRGLIEVVVGFVQPGADGAPLDADGLMELLAPFEMVISGYRETIAQLRRANDELLQANRDLATFSHAMAHDLRNPLATIAMWASLTQDLVAADPGAVSKLSLIEGIAGHAIELVADLLGYAELEHEAKVTEPVDLDLSLSRVITSLESAISDTEAVVTGRNLPVVPGRAAQLEHVLQNLVENSIKYRGEAAPRVRFDARRQGEMWIVRCRDNGRGIPKKFRDRVFEPFARGTSAVPGSGLGMAICQRIIEGHGGHIRVEASGATGTTVAFSLPALAV